MSVGETASPRTVKPAPVRPTPVRVPEDTEPTKVLERTFQHADRTWIARVTGEGLLGPQAGQKRVVVLALEFSPAEAPDPEDTGLPALRTGTVVGQTLEVVEESELVRALETTVGRDPRVGRGAENSSGRGRADG